jgi:hypothetical protein
MKFIDFLPFFTILGPSIEPEKASVKSASTVNPPSKVKFMGYFNNSRPEPRWVLIYHYHAMELYADLCPCGAIHPTKNQTVFLLFLLFFF